MSQLFKLDQNPEGPGLRCDSNGLFLGKDALLRRPPDGSFEALSDPELQAIFAGMCGDEGGWASRIRSVKLVADALNKGEVARAMIAAVLMRLPEPGNSIYVDDDNELLAKAGFNPDESRNERGQWTNGAEGNADNQSDDVRLAYAGLSDVSTDPAAQAVARAAESHQITDAYRAAREPTTADMASFRPAHYKEAQQLAAKLGHGATAQEFLALSSVESKWGISFAALIAANFFGAHNSPNGPFPGQIGTYVSSGIKDVPGHLENSWLPPNNPKNPVQNLAQFSQGNGRGGHAAEARGSSSIRWQLFRSGGVFCRSSQQWVGGGRPRRLCSYDASKNQTLQNGKGKIVR
ncbi:MAG TPA: hypothetical protein VGK90_04745 [Rhizomicrobium sp.]|jgi:hypothetical protein